MARTVSSTAFPTMADQDPTKEYVCPYNKYHLISAKKYPMHVVGCRKMYTGNKFANCPFNARHEFPLMEYDYHISICPDKNFIEKEISSVPAPNVPEVNHHPVWNRPSPTEDWDAEADHQSFSISGSALECEARTAYDVIEDYQNQLEFATTVPSRPVHVTAINGDMSGLSKAQKKNLKRAQKRRLKHLTGGSGDEEDDDEDDEEPEDGVHKMTPEEKEEMLRKIAQEYALPGTRALDAFVDWVSILNQYCQKNKINQPKYAEAHNSFGGFGFSAVVTTERFFSDSMCKTKKEGKHSAARAALLGLNIAVSTPDPCRAPHQRGGDVSRIRELEANRQLLEHNIQSKSNQQRIIPGLSNQPTSSSQPSSRQQTTQQNPQSNSGVNSEKVTNQMAGVNLNQRQNSNDEWQVVGRRSKDSGNNNALRLAGRGRGSRNLDRT